MNPSIWEMETFYRHRDVIIIGAGFTGLWTAISIKEKFPSRSVLVMERSPVPMGASTRNAGFACFGSLTEIIADSQKMGWIKTLELVKLRFEGLQKIQNYFECEEIDFELCGGYEILNDGLALEQMNEVNEHLKKITRLKETFSPDNKKLKEFGLANADILVSNPCEGSLHSGKLLQKLVEKCQNIGVEFLFGTEVSAISENDNTVQVKTNNFEITAEKLIIATNAFTKDLIPDIDLVPVRGQILLTEPIENLQLKGTFHYDEGVDLVLGAKEKFNILSYLDDLQKTENHGLIHSCEIDEADFFIGSYSIGDRTRAFLKVQDGCDYKCTYCTIPLARGISRSDTIENVVKNAAEIAGKGIKEIVLTGVNIGDYGKGEFGNKKHEHTFLDLISELDKVEGIERIRISSIEPNLLKDESIDLVSRSKSFVPHFHIPLQSGSDDLLKLMKRRYLTRLYSERITKIREVMPDSCIGVDVIVGFPGETEEKFLETYNFLNELPISYLHVFTYSERENTEAAEMQDVVPIPERKRRNKMLRILSEKKKMAFYQTQIGKTLPVLWEHENKNGVMFGFTENYVRVQKPYDENSINQIENLKLDKIEGDGTVSVVPAFEEFLARI